MKVYKTLSDPDVFAALVRGAIGVIPTDTLYGIVASIGFPDAIQRVYEARSRPPQKSCIILIADVGQVSDMIDWNDFDRGLARQYWPGPVSIVLPVRPNTPTFLRPMDGALAFRVPDDDELRALLRHTGPLIAPSANLAGEKPASTIAEAQGYFGENVDLYVDAGDLSGNQPSALIRQKDGVVEVLRGSLYR